MGVTPDPEVPDAQQKRRLRDAHFAARTLGDRLHIDATAHAPFGDQRRRRLLRLLARITGRRNERAAGRADLLQWQGRRRIPDRGIGGSWRTVLAMPRRRRERRGRTRHPVERLDRSDQLLAWPALQDRRRSRLRHRSDDRQRRWQRAAADDAALSADPRAGLGARRVSQDVVGAEQASDRATIRS